MDNRIEEATKQIREALWMAYCSGRANNKYIPEEVLPDLLKRCQLFPQPLDDKELREKIAKEFEIARQEGALRRFADGFADADDILALLQQRIEQERERILNLLPEVLTRFDHNRTCFDCIESIKRQALKGGENDGS